MRSTTIWSMDFSLELEIEDICSLTFVLYFYLYSFNLCSFMFVVNINLWVLMVEMIG